MLMQNKRRRWRRTRMRRTNEEEGGHKTTSNPEVEKCQATIQPERHPRKVGTW